MAKLSNDELISAIEQEEATAINWADGPLAEQRAEALRRYNREPYGNEVDGRSQVVSNDVQDVITSIMPSLARVFLSGDEIGKFEPIDPSDTGAEIESECVNWYLMTRNDGYSTIYSALKDALLLGNSYVKCWWREDNSVKVERYEDLSDEELAIILQDKDVQVIEHEAHTEEGEGEAQPTFDQMGNPIMPPMLHDVKLKRVRADEYVQIAAVPPDEVLVSRTHRETSLQNADFVQHRRTLSIGELTELGYKVDPNIADDVDDENRPESLARDRYQENSLYGSKDDASAFDDSRRRVTLRETWIRLGDADNTQTLWRICLVGRTILHKEEADQIPLAAFSPILYPHSHVGESVYSLVEDIAELNTTITRQYLDNLYLANNARTVVDVDRVNIDDLLVSRPGGIVRTTGDPGSALMPLVTPDVGGAALQALEMLQGVKERRTGIARINQGAMDPNMLNRTATGASLMMSAGQAHLELIARCLAGGIKDLFLIVHALALKHSTKPLQIRLQNQFVTVNPREWKRRTDFALQVALGTGAPEQQMAKLTAIGQFMQQGMQIGLVNPQNMYEWGKEFLRVAGYRSPDKFLTKPQEGAQPPQQPNPLVQVEQIKQQSAHALKDKELQFQGGQAQQKAQLDAALEQQRMTNEIAAQDKQAQADASLAQFKATLDSETAVKLKLIEIAGQLLAQSMAPEPELPGDAEDDGAGVEQEQGNAQMQQMMAMLMQTVQQLAQASGAPKRIVRGPDGRAIGVETVQPGLQ
jgi:hypothetical protein